MADRTRVVLACDECGARNYKTTKAPEDAAVRFEMKKFCRHCKKHTTHREAR